VGVAGEEVIKCTVATCGLYYHPGCLVAAVRPMQGIRTSAAQPLALVAKLEFGYGQSAVDDWLGTGADPQPTP
jgi:hypothetical protein